MNTILLVLLLVLIIVLMAVLSMMLSEMRSRQLSMGDISRDLQACRVSEVGLKESEERVRLLLDTTAEAIYGIDLHGNCTFVNRSCLRMLGYGVADQMLGRNMHRLIHHSYADGSPMPEKVCRIYQAFREGKDMHSDEEVLWKADGTSFPVEYWAYHQVVDGKVAGAVVTFIDITERKRAEKELRESRERFRGLVETSYDWVWEVDAEGRYTYVSPQVRNILGYEPQEVLGKTPMDLMPAQEAARVGAEFGYLMKEHKPLAALENVNLHKDGHQVVLETNSLPFFAPDGSFLGYRGIDRDITGRKRSEEQIRHLADHDYLTDLPTMRLARDRLAMAIATARRNRERVAVMFIDLDGFKAINDTMGHDAGDDFLRQLARRLVAGERATTTFARVGGDEFLLVATELRSVENAALIADKVLRLISHPVDLGGKPVAVSASVGIALYPDDGEDIDRLVKLADKAMYGVKGSGKNGYAFAGGTP